MERPSLQNVPPEYIDYGEEPVRWVIVDDSGTKLFADVDNRAIVFSNKDDAYAIAHLDDFADQAPGEVNVAGVGETKWEALQQKIPFVEVHDAETATQLVQVRLAYQKQQLAVAEESAEEKPLTEE